MPATTTWFDRITNAAAPIATPALVFAAPAFQPWYEMSDYLFGVAPESAECTSIVVFAVRTVKNADAYKAAFGKFAEKAQADGAGVRAMFSFMDPDSANTALQFAFYDSPSDLVTPPSDVVKCYAGTPETDHVQVFGAWDDAFKAKMSTDTSCHYAFVKEMRGFLKGKEYGAKGFKTGSPPMIWVSKRNIQPGRMEVCGKNFIEGTKRMFWNAPAALGVMEYTTDDNPDSVWSLRVFNDFDTGFKAHFPVPSFILLRMVWNVIPEWSPGKFPFGVSFSSKEYIDKAVAANAGNKNYKQYHWDKDLIGPMPDFGKGF